MAAHPASAVPLSTAWLDPWERHRLAKIGLRRCSVGRAGAPAERRPCCGAAGGVDSVELLVIWEPSRDASVVALRRGPHGAQAMCSLCPRLSRRKPLKTVRFDSFVDTISYCDDLAAAAAAVAPAQIKVSERQICPPPFCRWGFIFTYQCTKRRLSARTDNIDRFIFVSLCSKKTISFLVISSPTTLLALLLWVFCCPNFLLVLSFWWW